MRGGKPKPYFPTTTQSGDTITIEIDGKAIVIDVADAALVLQYRWRIQKNNNGQQEYAQMTGVIGGKHPRKTIRLHRLLLGDAANGLMVDHVNGNGLDNRRANLRTCSPQENVRNTQKRLSTAASKYKGVQRASNTRFPWCAKIKIDRRSVHLGKFATESAAARAYDAAARTHFGQFAKLNFPDEKAAQ